MQIKPFDVKNYLETQEDIDGYLTEVMQSGGSPKFIAHAIAQAEQARAKLDSKLNSHLALDSMIKQPQIIESLLFRLLNLGYTIKPPASA